MRAMVLQGAGLPLIEVELARPSPGPGQVSVAVKVCGVCRTDLHIADGELAQPKLPLIQGHQIVGRVASLGEGVTGLAEGDRVGVPWLGETCGCCHYCHVGQENLCDNPVFTGYTRDGGFADYAVADARYVFALPEAIDDLQAAPLLCAGMIGYRCLRMLDGAERLGLYGFGAAAHIMTQVCVAQGREVYGFTRPGDLEGQSFARRLGATWAGGSDEPPPVPLDAAVIFAPIGSLVPEALRRVRKGGLVVCAGIHMSDIPAFPYELLWGERSVRSVANLTRADGEEFLALAAQVPVTCQVTPFPLGELNEALTALRRGRIKGAAVVVVAP